MKIKSEAKRNAILEVAEEVFREFGFEAASMAVIAARVGGSKATLYNHFRTKEELFVEIMRAAASQHGNRVFATLDTALDLPDKLADFAINYLKFITSEELITIRRMAIAQVHRSDIGKQIYECGIKLGLTRLAAIMEKGIQDGELIEADPWAMALHLRGLLEAGIMEKCLLGVQTKFTTPALRKSSELALEVFLRAYQK